MHFKPTGYNSASPYFIVADAQKFIALMQTIFDAKDLRRYDLPNGKIAHAEILIDDTVVMLSDATEKYPPMPIVMHVYVADVDAVFQKGCTVVEQPKTQEGAPINGELLPILQEICGRLAHNCLNDVLSPKKLCTFGSRKRNYGQKNSIGAHQCSEHSRIRGLS